MPFGLIKAPVTFQRMMHGLLGSLLFVKVYLNDIVGFSESIIEQV